MSGGILHFLLWLAAMVVLAVCVKSRAEWDGDRKVVEFSFAFWIVGAAGLVMLGLMIRDVVSGNPKATVTDWRVPAFFGAILLPLILEVVFRRVLFTEDSVIFRSPWSRSVTAKWTEIVGVTYSSWVQWHCITLVSGRRIYLPEMLSGKEELLEVIASKRQLRLVCLE